MHQHGSWAAASPPDGLIATCEIRAWLRVGAYAEPRELGLLAARGAGAMLQPAELIPQRPR